MNVDAIKMSAIDANKFNSINALNVIGNHCDAFNVRNIWNAIIKTVHFIIGTDFTSANVSMHIAYIATYGKRNQTFLATKSNMKTSDNGTTIKKSNCSRSTK